MVTSVSKPAVLYLYGFVTANKLLVILLLGAGLKNRAVFSYSTVNKAILCHLVLGACG